MPKIGVLPRAGGPVRWFEAPRIMYSHTLNAYDHGTSIIVDLTTFPAPFHPGGRGSGGPGATGSPSLDRWTIDLTQARLHTSRLDDRPQEYPRLNESFVTRRHRYGYSAAAADMFLAYESINGVPPDRTFTNALIKHDLRRGTSETHHFPREAAASEPVFVPTAHPTTEDDGYAITYVHNPHRGASDLVILSTQDFTTEPLARIHLPNPVPLGFHGNWIPDA
ncbi:carotenoid oxygenase family protein [Actinophytocola xinjiangensis]|uniref:carotenoid oxygenase family protein n=1 Tax=Actinophytocola xinjiangensis TaxID=485602 RepID=UPI001FEB41F5|nr:carotenoid oxygenase family protein [Actinophytocola xinjiangensis]